MEHDAQAPGVKRARNQDARDAINVLYGGVHYVDEIVWLVAHKEEVKAALDALSKYNLSVVARLADPNSG
jgi:hypothetical protein